MANWKKVIVSGSNAELAHVSSSGGMHLASTLITGDADSLVLVQDTVTGKILTRTQAEIGATGGDGLAFTSVIPGTGTTSTAANATDTLTFTAGDNMIINGTSDGTIAFSATTSSIEDIQDIVGSMVVGQNITVNYDDTSNQIQLTGSSTLNVTDTSGQTGINQSYDTTTNTLSASADGLSTTSNVEFANIIGTDISSSGNISGSSLHITNNADVGGDLALDGNFIFQGFTFSDSNTLNHSGSNVFGSGSSAQSITNTHQFTGSISITGSGVTLVDGIFYGNGSGLTDLNFDGSGLFSGSEQVTYGDITGIPDVITGSATISTLNLTASANTGAVVNGGAGLSTQDQIYDFVTDQVTSNTIIGERGVSINSNTASLSISSLTQHPAATLADTDFIGIQGGGDLSSSKASLQDVRKFLSSTFVMEVEGGAGLTDATVIDAAVPGHQVTLAVGQGNQMVVNANDIGITPNPNFTTITTSGIATIGGNTTIAGNVTAVDATFTGNLIVQGNTTTLSTETLSVEDNFIDLNSNITTGAPTQDAGINIKRGDEADTQLFWDEGIDRWSLGLVDIDPDDTTATPVELVVSAKIGTDLAPSTNFGAADTAAYRGGLMYINSSNQDIWIYS